MGDSISAACKYCSVTVKAHVKSLKAHMESVKHQSFVKSTGATTSLTKLLTPKIPDLNMVNELKLAIYVAEHASALSVDHWAS